MNIPSLSAAPAIVPPALAAWNDLVDARVAHGFFGRAGGVSRGAYAALNLSRRAGDAPQAVEQNWSLVRTAAPPGSAFALLRQVHGKAVRIVDAGCDGALEGDGMVTARAGVMLGVLTADCVPILLIDAERKIAGALHAGWRGTLLNIAAEGVAAMAAAGAHRGAIRAALGPSIGPCCFEVGADLAERFKREVRGVKVHVRAGRAGKAFLDLRAILRGQLEAAGLAPGSISNVGPCTRCAAASFFSRRAAGGAATGLQLSYVGVAP